MDMVLVYQLSGRKTTKKPMAPTGGEYKDGYMRLFIRDPLVQPSFYAQKHLDITHKIQTYVSG